MEMEIIIKSPTEGQYLQKIDFNFEELKTAIKTSMKKYDNLFYDDDQIKTAKADRANLNNFIKVLDSKRKEVKEKCLVPYAEFETKIKELQLLVEEPVAKIDTQVKTYENGKKAEKKTAIVLYYKEKAIEIADLVDLEQIFDERWLNSSVSITSVNQEIDTKIEQIRNDFKAIAALNSEFIMQIKDKYLQTLNLSAALQEKTRLEEQQAKLKAYEDAKKATVATTEPVATDPQSQPIQTLAEQPEVRQIDFRVWVTNEQKVKIKEFFTTNNIKYGAVK